MNGLTLLALIAFAIGLVAAWRAGIARGRRERLANGPLQPIASAAARVAAPEAPSAVGPAPASEVRDAATGAGQLDAERHRLIVSGEARAAALERMRTADAARLVQLGAFADERRTLLRELADARGETARYRSLLVDLENDAPSLFLGAPGSTDDLKLIVGVGPVLERMLHQLGVTTYRQIARWTERDIDDFDGRLPEFPGRIRRDEWVTQAHALHQSKYGEALPPARAR